jgi:oxygen-independent coproporphyrinogen-3 oxidase
LGLGPSAHSFDGSSRQWNVKSNSAYIASIEKGSIPSEVEVLTEAQRYNEYILTSLRTIWGVDPLHIQRSFSENIYSHFEQGLKQFVDQKMLLNESGKIVLAKKGKLFADKISSDLFYSP